MIKIVLLSVTLLLVNSAARKQNLILENVMKELNTSIPEDLENKLVPDSFNTTRCSKEYLCKVQATLKEIKHDFMKKWNINRALQAYHNVTICHINKNGNELQVKDLLTKVRHCVQQLYARP